MKYYLKYICLLTLFLCCMGQPSYANNDATKAYQAEKLNMKSFDAGEWSSLKSGMQYSKKPKAKKAPKKKPTTTAGTGGTLPPPPRPRQTSNYTFKDFAQTLLIFLAVIVLAFVIFKAVAGDAILVNKQVARKRPTTLKELETNLVESDVESFLQKALNDKDYRLAIRLYYLAIIKELSLKGAIDWKKEKTNGHYMRELRSKKHPQLKNFRNVTRIFEYVWYSDMEFDGGQFEEVRINFKDLLQTVK